VVLSVPVFKLSWNIVKYFVLKSVGLILKIVLSMLDVLLGVLNIPVPGSFLVGIMESPPFEWMEPVSFVGITFPS
jgi:hypothetical protein